MRRLLSGVSGVLLEKGLDRAGGELKGVPNGVCADHIEKKLGSAGTMVWKRTSARLCHKAYNSLSKTLQQASASFSARAIVGFCHDAQESVVHAA